MIARLKSQKVGARNFLEELDAWVMSLQLLYPSSEIIPAMSGASPLVYSL